MCMQMEKIKAKVWYTVKKKVQVQHTEKRETEFRGKFLCY